MGFHQKLRRFCKRNGLTDRQQLYLESLVNLRLEELRCHACGTLDGCGCASPGWPFYKGITMGKPQIIDMKPEPPITQNFKPTAYEFGGQGRVMI